MKIAFLTLGCKLNYAETSTYERGFVANGLTVVPWEDKADVYLINTCSVTERAEKKCRNVIRKMHRASPEAKIIVTGCYAELRRDDLQAIEGVALVFGAKEKSSVVPKTMQLLLNGGSDGTASPSALRAPSRPAYGGPPVHEATGGHGAGNAITAASLTSVAKPAKATVSDAIQARRPMSAAEYKEISKETMAAFSSEERTRSFLKVQDGCNNFCKYCTVPYARGESRNIPISECVCNARKIAQEGVKEIVLTGVNTGDFGRSTGESFLDLLKALEQVDGIERYRISSIEPNLLEDDIIDWIASGTRFQPHFHIPLQAGTDELLCSMGRHYDTAFFERKIDYVRQKLEAPGKPLVFFGIDVMAGLPGETEELFRSGMDFIRRIRPAFIHVFPYSRRPGTPAAEMPGQVSDKDKRRRVEELEKLCAELHASFIEANRGIKERVLFESTDRGGRMEGYTGNYIRIEREYDPALCGKIVDVVI